MSAKLQSLVLLLVTLLAMPSESFAHRLDEYLQATLVAIEPDFIRLQINLTPGVAVADQVLALIDRDHDGVISASEAAAYAELVKSDLKLRLDGRDVEMRLTGSDFPTPAEIRTGLGILVMEFMVKPGPLATGTHWLAWENRHLPAVSVYLVNAVRPKSGSMQIVSQKRNEDQSTGEIEFAYDPPVSAAGAGGNVMSFAAPLIALFVGIWWIQKSSLRPA